MQKRNRNLAPKAPASLGKVGKATWRHFHAEFGVDIDAEPILVELCEAADRKAQAQEILRAEGVIIEDRFKQKRQHPAVAIERDSRLAILRAARALGLPLSAEAEKRKPGRPTAHDSRLRRVK